MIQEHKIGEKRQQVLKACVRSFRGKAEDIKLALVQNEDVKESLGVCLTIIQDQQVQIDCLSDKIEKELVQTLQMLQE